MASIVICCNFGFEIDLQLVS